MLREMIDERVLVRRFAAMGARLVVREARRKIDVPMGATVDVLKDGEGEYFEIAVDGDRPLDVSAVDVRPESRHLLLMVKSRRTDSKHKFLCGHDEREWFVAAVPERARAKDVTDAMEALKPRVLRVIQDRARVKPAERNRRRNAAFVRQGEWFFRPARALSVPEWLVLRREPLLRGNGSKPHMVEELYRFGGQRVYVCRRYPNGVTEAQYRAILGRDEKARNLDWREMRTDMRVFARGRVSHRDHATIVLDVWHEVLINTEGQAEASGQVRFLD